MKKNTFKFLKITYLLLIFTFIFTGCSFNKSKDSMLYKKENSSYTNLLKIKKDEIKLSTFTKKNNIIIPNDKSSLSFDFAQNNNSIALFDMTNNKVLYSNNIFDTKYPASLTKLLIAYIILEKNTLDDIVVISESAVNLDYDSQSCNFLAGDKVRVIDLLSAMLIYSGNDSANALAEYITTDSYELEKIMNDKLNSLGATNSYFDNPSGLHSYNHFSSAYDIYLIFNKCLQYDTFKNIINKSSYSCNVIHSNQIEEQYTWESTIYYYNGLASFPLNYNLLGGKTGTTDEAGACLTIYFKDKNNNEYIAIFLNATSKEELYNNISILVESIENLESKTDNNNEK